MTRQRAVRTVLIGVIAAALAITLLPVADSLASPRQAVPGAVATSGVVHGPMVNARLTGPLASLGDSLWSPAAAQGGGTSLQDLMRDYWTWALGGPHPDHKGNTVFLAVPPGTDFDPDLNVYVGQGSAELKPNESFFLPVFVFYGESYNNGWPDDDPGFPPTSAFVDANVLVTIDGNSVIDSSVDDLADYYADTVYFKKPIPYAEPTWYGSIAAIWVKGIGFEQAPLAPGEHTLDLLITSDFLAESFGFAGWHNTWDLTVD